MASKVEEIHFENLIQMEQRFAQRDKHEYHVFSTETGDATTIDKWVGLHKPFRVLIDPTSYDKLKNKRIKWVFNDEKVLVGCNIITQ